MTDKILYNSFYREGLKTSPGYSYIHFLVLYRPVAFTCLVMSFLGSSYLSGGRDYSSLSFTSKLIFFGPGILAQYLTIYVAVLGFLLHSALPGYIDLMKRQAASLWRIYVLFIFLGIQFLLTDYPDIAQLRLEYFLSRTLPLILIVALFPFKSEQLALRNVFYLLGIAAVALVVYFNHDPASVVNMIFVDDDSRFSLESDPITTGCNLLMGAIAGICILLQEPATRTKKIFYSIAILILIFAASITGSKGPLLSFTCAIILLIYLFCRNNAQRLLLISLLGSIIIVSYLLVNHYFPTSHLFYKDETRAEHYRAVLNSKSLIYGNGIGSFGTILGGGDKDSYVHNLFLELFIETGLVGVVLFSWIIIDCFGRLLRSYVSNRHPALLFCLCGLVFFFVEAQFSGYLLGDKALFAFMIMGTWLATTSSEELSLPE